jgi:hypothetical protein
MQKTILCALMIVLILAGCTSGNISSVQRTADSSQPWFQQESDSDS